MLYVATVHYRSPRWIEIQASYLRRHISVPYQTWGSIEEIDSSFASNFDRVIAQRGQHAGKLNHLALEICHVASDDDLIMFLDGDAFPIADPMPVVTAALAKAPLVAVRRAENVDEPQPHPCFCVTTVATWRRLPGDWSVGNVWRGVNGAPVSDVGGNLLRALELSEMRWVPLLRTNGTKLHPLFFAVYGDIIYHHGAGFRADDVIARADRERVRARAAEENRVSRVAKRGIDRVRGRRWNQSIHEHNVRQSSLVYEAIRTPGSDWLRQVMERRDA